MIETITATDFTFRCARGHVQRVPFSKVQIQLFGKEYGCVVPSCTECKQKNYIQFVFGTGVTTDFSHLLKILYMRLYGYKRVAEGLDATALERYVQSIPAMYADTKHPKKEVWREEFKNVSRGELVKR